jgi:hypothetical protein
MTPSDPPHRRLDDRLSHLDAVLVPAQEPALLHNTPARPFVPPLVLNGEDRAYEEEGPSLATWPPCVAALPTELTRVSLFSLVRRGRRRKMEGEKLSSRADVAIHFWGEQLDQADADLWLACLHMGRGKPLGQRLYTTRAQLLHTLGRCDGTSDRKWLDAALDRFLGAALRIRLCRHGEEVVLRCHLMSSGIEKGSGRLFIRLDPEGAALFENLAYLQWETRLALGSAMAKALHLYVCGHQQGQVHAVKLADLALWMGYEGTPAAVSGERRKRA